MTTTAVFTFVDMNADAFVGECRLASHLVEDECRSISVTVRALTVGCGLVFEWEYLGFATSRA